MNIFNFYNNLLKKLMCFFNITVFKKIIEKGLILKLLIKLFILYIVLLNLWDNLKIFLTCFNSIPPCYLRIYRCKNSDLKLQKMTLLQRAWSWCWIRSALSSGDCLSWASRLRRTNGSSSCRRTRPYTPATRTFRRTQIWSRWDFIIKQCTQDGNQ